MNREVLGNRTAENVCVEICIGLIYKLPLFCILCICLHTHITVKWRVNEGGMRWRRERCMMEGIAGGRGGGRGVEGG